MKRKMIVSATAAVLVLCCAIGGTLAWLTDKTDPVVNTFTVGDVNIALAETTGTTYKMVPGCTIDKDPTVTVTENSEACWLFVKADKSEDFDAFMTCGMADGWTALDGEADVFCRKVESAGTAQEFPVLADDRVAVKDSVTKEQMEALTAESYPTLTFTAYAVQLYKTNGTSFTAAEAWNLVSAGL